MRCLITGVDGYLGWPTALKAMRRYPEALFIGVDNLARRRWVEECGAVSGVPILDMAQRLETAARHGLSNLRFIEGDLTDRDFVLQLLGMFRPDKVLHMAAQPSAPYSQINGELANYTQNNNTAATRNLIFGIKETGLNETTLITTTTTGVYGAPAFALPEGYMDVTRHGVTDRVPAPMMAGSWYHMSRAHDACNLYLAARQFPFPVVDIRTAIVYGLQTPETQLDPGLTTRFDFDFYFGVVANRFLAMCLVGHPITVYGQGLQAKPFISLEDAARSLVLALDREFPPGELHVFNQVERCVSIMELAASLEKAAQSHGLPVEIRNVENPRIENEEHRMVIENDRFMDLIGHFVTDLEREMTVTMESLMPHKETIERYKDRFLPE